MNLEAIFTRRLAVRMPASLRSIGVLVRIAFAKRAIKDVESRIALARRELEFLPRQRAAFEGDLKKLQGELARIAAE